MSETTEAQWQRFLGLIHHPLVGFLSGVAASIVAAWIVAGWAAPSKDYVNGEITRLEERISPLETKVMVDAGVGPLKDQVNRNEVQQMIDAANRANHGDLEARVEVLEREPPVGESPSGISMVDFNKLASDVNELKRTRPSSLKPQFDELRGRVAKLEDNPADNRSNQPGGSEITAQLQRTESSLADLKSRLDKLDKAHLAAMEQLEADFTYQLSLAAQPQAASRNCQPPNTSRAKSFRSPRPLEPLPRTVFPPEHEARNLTAPREVVLCLTISTEGNVIHVEDLSQPRASVPLFQAASGAAASRRYAPGLIEGQPTEWRVIAGVPFGKR